MPEVFVKMNGANFDGDSDIDEFPDNMSKTATDECKMMPRFTDEEIELLEEWVDMDSPGWPYREGCPPEVKQKLDQKIHRPRTDNVYAEIEERVMKRLGMIK